MSRTFTPEHRNKISLALKGIPKSKAHRQHIAQAKTGLKQSLESRIKISDALKGKNNPNFKHGKTIGKFHRLVIGNEVMETRPLILREG